MKQVIWKINKQWLPFGIMFIGSILLLTSCEKGDVNPVTDPIEAPTYNDSIFYLPVVVHVIHSGENIGEGSNLSTERIQRQIEILNEDFRRKEGTRGFNRHPDGGDAKIEFVLAKIDPDGNITNGINRVDETTVDVPMLGYNQNHYAQYAYWNSDKYINVWTTPLPEASTCLVFGAASGPNTDLPGGELFSVPGPNDKEGMIINRFHFGESDIDCHARYGRTLTRQMAVYLGLLNLWGALDCENNDFCEDTPAVDRPVYNLPFVGCKGETVQVSNYMSWSYDEQMNMFTNDQIARMHYVLENSTSRNSLLTSPALQKN